MKERGLSSEILITVNVVTYNSSKYVLETLESVKAQTYQNIELIITDDCSTDNTVAICEQWIRQNNGRFPRCELITGEENEGIPANCNRGLKAAKGEWIKGIAGDDILDINCIQNFIDYSRMNPEASVISGSIQFFSYTFSKENFGIRIRPEEYTIFRPGISAEQQYNILLRRCFVWGSSLIIKKAALMNVGGYDTNYRWIEDWPVFLKLTKAGYKIHGTNKLCVYYRRHDTSVLSDPKNKIFSENYKRIRAFRLDYIYPNITVAERIAHNIEYFRHCTFDYLGLNKPTLFHKWLFAVTSRFNPARLILDNALRKSLMII
jgi:GT2 family glycosyltransferase